MFQLPVELLLSTYVSQFCRRNSVSEEVKKAFPGNTVANFKKSSEALQQVQKLTDKLVPLYSFAQVGFGPKAIRQHILDTLNERRRRARKGFDFTKPVFYTLAVFANI